jgi:hypothetical protein
LNSLGFDGLNDFVAVPNYAAIQLSVSDFSIDAWVLRRLPDQGRRVIVSKLRQMAVALGPRGYEFYLNNGVMNLFLGGVVAQNFNSGVIVPADNAWHHVAVTVRRGNGVVRFYLDGVQVFFQAAAITAPLANNSRLYVGAGTFPMPNSFFHGGIDEVEIFNRALSPVEIASLWAANYTGKCKVWCSVPWDVSIPRTANCVTVQARICNNLPVPMPVTWAANGPMPFVPPNGSVVLPPFTCTNIPIQVCRPTNTFPVGAVVQWTFTIQPGTACPIVCTGSVINSGPIIIAVPTDPVGIPGTNRTAVVSVDVGGLAPGQLLRLRAVGPDMEPDMSQISLNGLPPGESWIIGAPAGAGGLQASAPGSLGVPVRFVADDPSGTYTILIEADVDTDGEFDTLSSFDLENPVVSPPTILVRYGTNGYYLDWMDEGDGLGTLEAAGTPEGPWDPVPNAAPGYPVAPTFPQQYFRIAVPGE